MKIRKLTLKNFGPFRFYELNFPDDSESTVLLVGRNNEGKSSIIRSLKFISDALKVINKRKNLITVNDEPFYQLMKQDIGDIRVGRLIYNYAKTISEIRCEFTNNLNVIVYLDPERETIYADYFGRIPSHPNDLIGFLPPLGPITEHEEVLSNTNYLKSNINTSLAPRHLRNYFHQLCTPEQFSLIKEIINETWPQIQLDSISLVPQENRLDCFYKEQGIIREISWAGQGLQIWMQIITHLVLSLHKKVLVLDEPEVNLHTEKQNDLISIIKQYFNGDVIIATHSIELMNNSLVSHIINIDKNKNRTRLILPQDRESLEKIRSSIGSHFNFNITQFEEVDYLIFSENAFDYRVISSVLTYKNILKKLINVHLLSFGNYKNAISYKDAYRLYIGKNVKCIVFLDQDYYPYDQLIKISEELKSHGIRTVYTPGKEIENIFIYPRLYKSLLNDEQFTIFVTWLESTIEHCKEDAFADYTGTLMKYDAHKEDFNTQLKRARKEFDNRWDSEGRKYNLVPGKKILKALKTYFQQQFHITLTDKKLIELLVENADKDQISFILEAFE